MQGQGVVSPALITLNPVAERRWNIVGALRCHASGCIVLKPV